MIARRCVICTRPPADHATNADLARYGYAPHRFDPGERRQGERRGTGSRRPAHWQYDPRVHPERRVDAARRAS